MKLVILVVGATLLITTGLIFGLPYLNNDEEARIEITPLEYDAGTVSMADGLVKKTFEIRNNGDDDLKINRIWTSCMCTTARLKVGDKQSPEFGMHSTSTFWSQEISPEETGYLEVVFNPVFHGPQGTGQVIRAVYLSTNDSQNQEVQARLLVNVIP